MDIIQKIKCILNEDKFIGIEGRNLKPTKNHRPAIWENMLGTVYAMNDNGEVKYFDYKHNEAKDFANIANKKDIRIFKFNKSFYPWRVGNSEDHAIRNDKKVLWVEK